MSAFHRRGQHRRPETVPTQPSPVERTDTFRAVTLLQDPVTETFPVPVPAPVQGPAALPPLRPAPAPRPRTAWVPGGPPAPPRPAPIRITEPAELAAEMAATWPGLFTLPCGTCHRVHTRGGTASFQALYVLAEQAGWRRDGSGGAEWREEDGYRTDRFGVWACPACQAQPGWRAPNTSALAGEHLEFALAQDVAAQATDTPVLDTFRQAQRRPRYYLNASALEAVKSE